MWPRTDRASAPDLAAPRRNAVTRVQQLYGFALEWLPFLLILGPAAYGSLTISGFVSGVVSSDSMNTLHAVLGHLQAGCTACVYVVAVQLVWSLRDQGRGWPASARVPRAALLAGTAVIVAASVAVIVDCGNLDGGSDVGQYFQVGSVALWGSLMIPTGSGLIARLPDRAHRRASRRSAAVVMTGCLASCVALVGARDYFYYHAPTGMVYRQYLADLALSNRNNVPAPTGIGGLVLNIGNNLGNAVLEEVVFATVLLALLRAGRGNREIIAVAFGMRALVHLYYGPVGIVEGLFGAANGYALLRWRRLWPLVVMHALYDVLSDVTGEMAGFPRTPLAHVLAISVVCLASMGLLVAVDFLLRPAPRAEAAV